MEKSISDLGDWPLTKRLDRWMISRTHSGRIWLSDPESGNGGVGTSARVLPRVHGPGPRCRPHLERKGCRAGASAAAPCPQDSRVQAERGSSIRAEPIAALDRPSGANSRTRERPLMGKLATTPTNHNKSISRRRRPRRRPSFPACQLPLCHTALKSRLKPPSDRLPAWP